MAKKRIPKLLGKSDLMRRWGIGKSGMLWRSKNHDDFPKPITHVHDGKTPLYDLADVVKYEEKHGWTIEPQNGQEKGN